MLTGITGFTGIAVAIATVLTFNLLPTAVTVILGTSALLLAFYADYRKAN